MNETELEPAENPLNRLIDRLVNGIPLAGGFLYAKSVGEGQLKEERRLELYFRRENDESRLLQATIFPGRPQFFRPWVEISNIQDRMLLNRKTIVFLDSDLECTLHQLLAQSVSAGGKIFVDYAHDRETRTAMELGVPAPASRIGHILFLNGITGFRDFQHPAAHAPCGCKLQGLKANGDETRRRHLSHIKSQLTQFLQSRSRSERTGDVMDRAIRRAKSVLESIQEMPCSLPC